MEATSVVRSNHQALQWVRELTTYQLRLDHPLLSVLANQENVREKGSFVCAHSARDQRTYERNPCWHSHRSIEQENGLISIIFRSSSSSSPDRLQYKANSKNSPEEEHSLSFVSPDPHSKSKVTMTFRIRLIREQNCDDDEGKVSRKGLAIPDRTMKLTVHTWYGGRE